jgi:hypothetical protein
LCTILEDPTLSGPRSESSHAFRPFRRICNQYSLHFTRPSVLPPGAKVLEILEE